MFVPEIMFYVNGSSMASPILDPALHVLQVSGGGDEVHLDTPLMESGTLAFLYGSV